MDKKQFLTLHGPVTAVRSWHCPAELRPQALSRIQSLQIVAEIAREASPHLLANLCTLASGVEPPRSTTVACYSLVSDLESAVAAREILFIKGWDFARTLPGDAVEAGAAESPAETLARQLMADRTEIKFEGRRYRWAGSKKAIEAAARQGYRPVPPTESVGLVKRMAEQVAATSDEHAVWSKAMKESAVKEPEGPAIGGGRLTLLRYLTTAGRAASSTAPEAITPSKLKADVAPEHWIQIEVVYEDGTPFEGSCVIELPDGRRSEGPPGEAGKIRIDALTAAGDCKVRFPDLDAGSFHPK